MLKRPTYHSVSLALSRINAGLWVFACLLVLTGCGGASGADEIPLDGDADTAAATDGVDGDGQGEAEPMPSETEEADLSDLNKACIASSDCAQGLICDGATFSCQMEEGCNTPDGCADCMADSDCPSSRYCTSVGCVARPSCTLVRDLTVSGLRLLHSGQSYHVHVQALNRAGVPVGGQRYLLQSLNSEIVAVGSDATVQGGTRSGTTSVVVTLADANGAACSGNALSATLSLTNFTAPAAGQVRVLVVDAMSGEPIGHAQVRVGTQSATTDAEAELGVALFAEVGTPYDLHVFHTNYHYFSALQLGVNDVLVPLMPYAGAHRMAGIKAAVDMSAVPEAYRQPYAYVWMNTAQNALTLGEDVRSLLAPSLLSQADSLHAESPWPANIYLDKVGSAYASSSLYAFGPTGARLAWAIGGFVSAQSLLGSFVNLFTQGESAYSALILAGLVDNDGLVGFHGLVSGLSLTSAPMCLDDGQGDTPNDVADLNGNGLTSDWVPDYGQTQDIGTVSVRQILDQPLSLSVGPLPMPHNGTQLPTGVLALVGVRTSGREFVPLGIGAQVGTALGSGGTVTMTYARPYGALDQGEPLRAMVMALDTRALFSTSDGAVNVSTVLQDVHTATTRVVAEDFLGFLDMLLVFPDERRILFTGLDEAGMYRVRVGHEGRHWDIWLPQQETADFILPTPPDDPFDGTADVLAVETTGDRSLDDAVNFSGASGLEDLDRFVTRYSVTCTVVSENGEKRRAR